MINDSDLVKGYAGKTYTIKELREHAKKYSYGKDIVRKKDFESIYNNPSKDNLNGEVWVRLSQKGWNRYLVSNKGRVKLQNNLEEPILLTQVDELDKNANPHFGYLVFDPNQLPRIIQHNYHVWRIIAMAFLGLNEGDQLVVHHIDNNGYNCQPENLILVSKEEHASIHQF